MAIDGLIGIAESRINRYLRDNAIHIPDNLIGCTINIQLQPLGTLYCLLQARRIILSKQSTSNIDVTMKFSAGVLLDLLQNKDIAMLLLEKRIEMTGDIGTAQALRHWLNQLHITKDDILAELFGEILGPVISQLDAQLRPQIIPLLDQGKTLLQQLINNNPITVTQTDNQQTREHIQSLRQQADRLQARIQQLNNKLNPENH